MSSKNQTAGKAPAEKLTAEKLTSGNLLDSLKKELEAEKAGKKALEVEFDQMQAAHAEQIDKMARHIAEAKKARPTRRDMIIESISSAVDSKIQGYKDVLSSMDELGPMTDELEVKLKVFENLRKLRTQLRSRMKACNEFLTGDKDTATLIFGENTEFAITSAEFVSGVMNAFNAGLDESLKKVDAEIKSFKFTAE